MAEQLECRATDRVKVDLVLASGVMISDYILERPAFRQDKSDLSNDDQWVLRPGTIIRLKNDLLTLSFDLPSENISNENGLVTIVGIRRTIHVEFYENVLIHLVDGLSAGETISKLTDIIPIDHRNAATELIKDLISLDAVMEKMESRSKLSHEWSMRGTNARGHLNPSEIVALTFDKREHQIVHTRQIKLASLRPFPIDSLSKVLHARRSPTIYNSGAINLDTLGQLLIGACGITGKLTIDERQIGLRAYPSPGALYAVDVYIIPTRVEGLSKGVYRFNPDQNVLEIIHEKQIDPSSFCLPDTRKVVDGVAAFISLSISLPRAVRKYGDVSYRILVAEAGCIAQNLVMVAHALGLQAGPFTGVFDSLVDQAIGLHQDEARFVVGVLIGHKD